jgi:hypothetical protein
VSSFPNNLPENSVLNNVKDFLWKKKLLRYYANICLAAEYKNDFFKGVLLNTGIVYIFCSFVFASSLIRDLRKLRLHISEITH